MSKLLNRFQTEYDFLYENNDRVAGYREAVTWFDQHQNDENVAPHRNALIEERGDFISSDREAAAFSFAYEALDL